MSVTIVFSGMLSATSCTKKASTEMIDDPLDTTAVLLYSGDFSKGPYGSFINGQAAIYKVSNKWQLRLENFSVSNGPDLKIYLSKEQQPVHFIKVGDLKSVSGNQTYEISGMPDIMEYKYALIHCEQYNHLFGYTILVMQ